MKVTVSAIIIVIVIVLLGIFNFKEKTCSQLTKMQNQNIGYIAK